MGSTETFSSRREMLERFESYTRETHSAWRCVKSNALFGKTVDEIMQHRSPTARLQWSHGNSDGISLPFDGIPFICIGTINYLCHQGDDVDRNTKLKRTMIRNEKEDHDHAFQKRRNRYQCTKKLGCPSKLFMSRILKFPEFKVGVNPGGPKPKRKMQEAAELLKQNLLTGTKVKIEDMFLLKLPCTESHKFHATEGEAANLREPIDPLVVEKIRQMQIIGVRSVAEVRRHLEKFVKDDLFCNEDLPPDSSRRYYPTDGDIRNILNASRTGDRRAPDDQINLENKCTEWKNSNPDDFIFYRQSTFNTDNETKTSFMFVYQAQWMKRLLLLYGQEMCLMDATYRTCRYALPLFFLCVRSNVGYMVVAVFIQENEDSCSISEALQIIKKENPLWNPGNMMVDFSLAEIAAIEECFPKAHIHVCDFHREKAWNEWLSKGSNGVSEYKGEVLRYLRNIARSTNQLSLDENINVLKESKPWNESVALQKYFSDFWGLHLEKWVRFYRDENLRVAIYTNNGIERQNNWLKQSYLEGRRNNSVSDLVDIILNQFLPDSYKKYKEKNIKCTSSYRGYDNQLPKYLHNRPKDVVDHIAKRIYSNINGTQIQKETPKLFTVKGLDKKYQVWLGSESQLPSCQCADFRTRKLPCKHICAVVQQPDVGWESLGAKFDTYPLFTLDKAVCHIPSSTNSEDTSHQLVAKKEDEVLPHPDVVCTPPDFPFATSECNIPHLPNRGKSSVRKDCIQSLKSLQDELYVVRDEEVLANTLAMINDIIAYTRKNIPRENGISLKDKSLSPKNTHVKSKYRQHKIGLSKLKLRKKKDYFKKRVGAVADARNTHISIADTENAKNVDDSSQSPKKRQRMTSSAHRAYNANECWVTIHGVKLTYRLRDILLNKSGWLTDDHIDAAQFLIRDLETGVGGLNSVVAMTHCSRFAVPHEEKQTIQCHNIGAHWVTSSSITGKVIIYESLNTTLNDSMKRQLVHLYKGLSNDNGSLDVIVILQQRQKGGSDCGLFCIANGMALACGMDPCKISWSQADMRQHVIRCFEQKKLEIFPHVTTNLPCTTRHYVISIFCVCFRHIPGGEMVNCNACKNWFHYTPPHNCIELTPKQISALVTKAPFICSYCEMSQAGMRQKK